MKTFLAAVLSFSMFCSFGCRSVAAVTRPDSPAEDAPFVGSLWFSPDPPPGWKVSGETAAGGQIMSIMTPDDGGGNIVITLICGSAEDMPLGKAYDDLVQNFTADKSEISNQSRDEVKGRYGLNYALTAEDGGRYVGRVTIRPDAAGPERTLIIIGRWAVGTSRQVAAIYDSYEPQVVCTWPVRSPAGAVEDIAPSQPEAPSVEAKVGLRASPPPHWSGFMLKGDNGNALHWAPPNSDQHVGFSVFYTSQDDPLVAAFAFVHATKKNGGRIVRQTVEAQSGTCLVDFVMNAESGVKIYGSAVFKPDSGRRGLTLAVVGQWLDPGDEVAKSFDEFVKSVDYR